MIKYRYLTGSATRQLTGFDDGNSQKAINIVTKTAIKNGQFGRAYAGYGTDERYAAGGNVSFFKGDRRLSAVANFNNINQQNFGSQDELGVTGGSNRWTGWWPRRPWWWHGRIGKFFSRPCKWVSAKPMHLVLTTAINGEKKVA